MKIKSFLPFWDRLQSLFISREKLNVNYIKVPKTLTDWRALFRVDETENVWRNKHGDAFKRENLSTPSTLGSHWTMHVLTCGHVRVMTPVCEICEKRTTVAVTCLSRSVIRAERSRAFRSVSFRAVLLLTSSDSPPVLFHANVLVWSISIAVTRSSHNLQAKVSCAHHSHILRHVTLAPKFWTEHYAAWRHRLCLQFTHSRPWPVSYTHLTLPTIYSV